MLYSISLTTQVNRSVVIEFNKNNATKLGDKLKRLASGSMSPAFLHPLDGISAQFT